LLGVQEVPSSNLGSPTKFLKDIQTSDLPKPSFWSPTGVHNGVRSKGRLTSCELSAAEMPHARSEESLAVFLLASHNTHNTQNSVHGAIDASKASERRLPMRTILRFNFSDRSAPPGKSSLGYVLAAYGCSSKLLRTQFSTSPPPSPPWLCIWRLPADVVKQVDRI
jgi:hypothetical protein